LHLLIEEDKDELVDFVLNTSAIKANPELVDFKT